MASQVRRVARLEAAQPGTADQRWRTPGDSRCQGKRGWEWRCEVQGLDPVVPSAGRMDDEDVAAADLKDVGRRAAIWVSLIKFRLKSHRGRATRALQWRVNGGQGSGVGEF